MTKSVPVSSVFDPVIAPRLISDALIVYDKTHRKETEVRAANIAARTKSNNILLDAMLVACDKPKSEFTKGNAATNAALSQVKAFFDECIKRGALEKSTADSYRSGFWYAFEQGVPWTADINNKKTEAKKAAKKAAKAAAAPVTGMVQSTSRNDLDKTLSKALAQARLLGLTEFAADLLDFCVDRLDGFTETVLPKK